MLLQGLLLLIASLLNIVSLIKTPLHGFFLSFGSQVMESSDFSISVISDLDSALVLQYWQSKWRARIPVLTILVSLWLSFVSCK